MSTRLFAFFILIMLFGIQSVYFSFKNQLEGRAELDYEIATLRHELERERTKTEIARYELESFQQRVALVLPNNIPGQDYSVRNIASIVSTTSPLAIKSKIQFSDVKKIYLDGQYEKASLDLKDYIKNYPDSTFVLEAYYLLTMSYYNSSQHEKALETVDILVEQFPESEMTGLGLLVMGDIMKKKERFNDAKEIYTTVINNFKYPELKKQAEAKLEEIKL